MRITTYITTFSLFPLIDRQTECLHLEQTTFQAALAIDEKKLLDLRATKLAITR
jgi:hypothetical protein